MQKTLKVLVLFHLLLLSAPGFHHAVTQHFSLRVLSCGSMWRSHFSDTPVKDSEVDTSAGPHKQTSRAKSQRHLGKSQNHLTLELNWGQSQDVCSRWPCFYLQTPFKDSDKQPGQKYLICAYLRSLTSKGEEAGCVSPPTGSSWGETTTPAKLQELHNDEAGLKVSRALLLAAGGETAGKAGNWRKSCGKNNLILKLNLKLL